jgi:aspartyl-tRNA(Asn)/glutamyl-tRNA(Gln) amidotransferase subunit A
LGFGAEVKRRILIGTYVLSAGYYDAYYLKAQKVRSLIKRDFDQAFETVDIILTPATPTPAFALGSKAGADPVEMYLNDIFTVTVNMAGLPGLAVPAGRSEEGLPLGLQIIGRPFDEGLILRAGRVIEDAVGRMSGPERWWDTRAATAMQETPASGKASSPKKKPAAGRTSPSAKKPGPKTKPGKKLNGAS